MKRDHLPRSAVLEADLEDAKTDWSLMVCKHGFYLPKIKLAVCPTCSKKEEDK